MALATEGWLSPLLAAAAEAAGHSSAIDQLNRRGHDAGVEFKESDLSIPGTPSLRSLRRYAERRLKVFLDGPAQFGCVFLFLFLFSIYLYI
jgi:hypothetical protein